MAFIIVNLIAGGDKSLYRFKTFLSTFQIFRHHITLLAFPDRNKKVFYSYFEYSKSSAMVCTEYFNTLAPGYADKHGIF
jgi:hypothetical protein